MPVVAADEFDQLLTLRVCTHEPANDSALLLMSGLTSGTDVWSLSEWLSLRSSAVSGLARIYGGFELPAASHCSIYAAAFYTNSTEAIHVWRSNPWR